MAFTRVKSNNPNRSFRILLALLPAMLLAAHQIRTVLWQRNTSALRLHQQQQRQVVAKDVHVQTNDPLFTDRMKRRFQYHAAASRTDLQTATTNNNNEECGSAPAFEVFFAQTHNRRSANNEDKTIYELFFRNDDDDTLQNRTSSSTATKSATKFGTYVEIGAFNGVQESNSRFFERCLHWEGLLIEAQPQSYEKLVSNRPTAHRVSFAASCSEQEEANDETVSFVALPMTNAGQGTVPNVYAVRDDHVEVPCGSLTPILKDFV